MSTPRLLRWVASLLIRGRDAPYLLTELDESFERDLGRGLPRPRASARYAVNMIASAWNLWRWQVRFPSLLRSASWLDVKLGVRMLRKEPLLTAVAIGALSIGIPASMLPLHLVESLTVDLPFPEGNRIVGIRNRDIVENRTQVRALHDYFAWKDEVTTLDAIGAARSDPYNVSAADGRVAPVRGSELTASAFDVLRVGPIMGRPLLESDEVKGAPEVVVISHEMWHSRLGADPDVIGSTIRIGAVPHEVVGVMPAGFLFPLRDLLWLPLRDRPTDFERGMGPDVLIFGRLADGVSIDEAQAEFELVGRRMSRAYPDSHEHLRPQVMGFTSMVTGVAPGNMAEMLLIQLVVLALLAIVCGNVGTLILARTAARSDEIAVRTALGASRSRIVSQLFIESFLLATVATSIGLFAGDRVAIAFTNKVFVEAPFWFDFGVRPRTVLFALGLAVFCAAVAGVVPALKATGRRVQVNLQRASTGSGVRFGWGSGALIVSEMAIAIGFLAMSGAIATQLLAGRSVDEGFERDHYVMAFLRVPWTDHSAVENDLSVTSFAHEVAHAHEELVRRLSAEPGVRTVALADRLPGMDHQDRRIEVEGEERAGDHRGHRVQRAVVDVGYFTAFHQRMLGGRDFVTSDLLGNLEDRSAVIVNAAFADHVLGGQGAVGRRIRYVRSAEDEPGPWHEIVGVVGHLGMDDLNPRLDQGVYHPGAPGEIHPLLVALHIGPDPLSFLPRLREIVAEVDADAMIQYPRVLSDAPNGDGAVVRYGTALLMFVSTIAIALSATGLYALMSFTVSQRRREIGIRMALGASARSIVGAISRRALAQILVGVALGTALGSWLVGLTVEEAGVHVGDTRLLLASLAVLMTLVGMAACLKPTLQGLRIRPAEALKER